jgi:hypothetical protein
MSTAIVVSKYQITSNKRNIGLLVDFPHSAGVESVTDITGRDATKVWGANTAVILEVVAPDAVLTSIAAHAGYFVLATDSATTPTYPGLDTNISVPARTKINAWLTANGYVLRVTTSNTYRQALNSLLAEIRA